jgi:hypothetical protein
LRAEWRKKKPLSMHAEQPVRSIWQDTCLLDDDSYTLIFSVTAISNSILVRLTKTKLFMMARKQTKKNKMNGNKQKNLSAVIYML